MRRDPSRVCAASLSSDGISRSVTLRDALSCNFTARMPASELAKTLKSEGAGVTVHVIGYMLSLANAPASGQFVSCLSEATGGLFLSTSTTAELISALRQTLGCPVMSSVRRPQASSLAGPSEMTGATRA
jgi:hypothetical protein